MTSDHISATVAYVMRREERHWNVSVLQTVHLSNLVNEVTFLNFVGIEYGLGYRLS
jgi:hypothetical protein